MTLIIKSTLVLCTLTALFISALGFAQEADKSKKQYRCTLNEAVNYSKQNNKIVAVSIKEAAAAEQDMKNVKNEALPNIEFGASYERFSDLTLYTSGLSEHTSGPRHPSPNGGNTGINASLNLYSGGKLRSLEQEAKIKKDIADLNVQDQTGNIGLQTANSYLDLLQLNERKKFVTEQLKRAETRLKNINALYQNQKVTRSDVLRAEVMLSNIKLSMEQVENDLAIRNRALTLFMNLDQTVTVIPADSAAMEKPVIESYGKIGNSLKQNSYPLQRASLLIESQEARLKTIKSNNYPVLSFRTAYNLNYPNYLFYPPVAQFYSIGFAGLNLRYDIASIYKNKHSTQAAKLRVEELQIQEAAVTDNVNQELDAIYIKYSEALHRIEVNKTSIEQAKVNYKIVSTKYFNQLALLTDLLDADNLFQETQYNLVQAQVEAFRIYYRLQYLQGKL